MVDSKKILSEIESIVYENGTSKMDADKIINNYVRLFDYTNFDNYKVTVKNNPVRLQIKHKAFNNKIFISFKKGNLFINEKKIDIENINRLLPLYFELDKSLKIS